MLTLEQIDALLEQEAPRISRAIRTAAQRAKNEAEFRAPVERLIEDVARKVEVELRVDRERNLLRGRADAVYNRFVIEFEPPRSLTRSNSHAKNAHAIQQVKDYIESISTSERHARERIAGATLDGEWLTFVRWIEGKWRVEEPVSVNPASVQTLLKYIVSLATELALTPENLLRDFGENTAIARAMVSAMYQTLTQSATDKTNVLFQQWSLQFGEVCQYGDDSSKLDVRGLVQAYGIRDRRPDPLRVLFALHSYYALFIKLLAVQIAWYYTPQPKPDTPTLAHVANLEGDELQAYLENLERGGVFSQLGISNFLEGDFFGWYLDAWNSALENAIRRTIAELAGYSLVTLDVDPDETRDLLKHLYQNLMPRELRHALGEYYTPDWLAERLLNQLGYQGQADKRILDPACGSGTFPVLEIKRFRRAADAANLAPARQLELILHNIMGFDLNPLAVISARTNYLLSLGELIAKRKQPIALPIYMADSIMTPSGGKDLFELNKKSFSTAVGTFSVPASLGESAAAIEQLANLLEECVTQRVSGEVFEKRLLKTFPQLQDNVAEIAVARGLFAQLADLDARKINGIWARILKNAFAPLFVGTFDFVAGNPPWVNWESLPDQYRRSTAPLWDAYALFPHKGYDAILGKCKDDISVLMTYVAMDKYLNAKGKLGFIITQSVLKTSGGGEGFRRFRLGREGEFIRPTYVDDFVAIQPFASASNRTIVIILEKGARVKYPVAYSQWYKTVSGKRIPEDATLELLGEMASFRKYVAEPVDHDNAASSWITGRARVLRATRKVIGESEYVGRAGVSTWLNGVYWLHRVSTRPDGLVVVTNATESSKTEVEDVQAALEADLLYPLVRASDVTKWQATSELYHLLPHLSGMRLNAIPEKQMAVEFPKTFGYLKRFEQALRGRSGFKRFFKPNQPFYSVYNVGDYTFAPHKVLWGQIGSQLAAAVTSQAGTKPFIPQHTVTLVAYDNLDEAHYLCALVNSSIVNFTLQSYAQRGGKSFATPHVLENISVPTFDQMNGTHKRLAELSQSAHQLAASADENKTAQLAAIESEIDALAARVWGLTDEELQEIQRNLAELA